MYKKKYDGAHGYYRARLPTAYSSVVRKNEDDRDANPDFETMPVDERRIYDFPLRSSATCACGVSRKCKPAGGQRQAEVGR